MFKRFILKCAVLMLITPAAWPADQKRMAQELSQERETLQEREEERERLREKERIYGWQLMTPAERKEYRRKMRGLRTREEREAYRREHRERMKKRAEEMGVELQEMRQ